MIKLCAAVAAMLLSCSTPPNPNPTVNTETKPTPAGIEGVWGGTIELASNGPPPRTVVVTSQGAVPTASIDGVGFALENKDGALSGRTKDGQELRLRRATQRGRLVGHYVQPPSSPWMSYPSAPPVVLTESDGGFRGTVEPFADRLRLYLAIRRAKDGRGTIAFIREPGRNLGRRFGTMTVRQSGDRYDLFDGSGHAQMSAVLAGDTLSLTIARLEQTVALTRRGRTNAPHYYPRASGVYSYSVPTAKGDGWKVGTLTSQGFDREAVVRLIETIATSEPTSWASPAVHSLLVARRGTLVVEEYFSGTTAHEPHDTRSAGKSFGTTLAGLADKRGLLEADAKLAPYLGRPPTDPRKAAITLEHAMTMTTGLECDDNDNDNSEGNEGRMQSQRDQPNWYQYIWSLPMVRRPGERAVYCSGGINLVGAAVAGATKQWIPDFFATALAEPLGIEHYHFNLMPNGQGYLGGGVRLRARDFAKLGQLYLQGGAWNGVQLLNPDWVMTATRAHASINEPNDYGYGWWLLSYDLGGEKVSGYYASGNGGQFIIVVPKLELVVAIMAGNYGNYFTWRSFRDYLAKDIAAAIVR
ncbi:MAG: beta-lactamase family protein [Proteobacteria bacterium]|nr:beta-lactamase family protein [Pseudomonadota bacterium]